MFSVIYLFLPQYVVGFQQCSSFVCFCLLVFVRWWWCLWWWSSVVQHVTSSPLSLGTFLHSLATRRAHSQMYAGGDDSDFACTNCSTAYHWHELPYSRTVAHRRIYPVLSISPFVSLLMAGNSFVVVELAVSCSSIRKSKVRLLMIYLFIVNCFVCLCATHLELVWLASDRSALQHWTLTRFHAD